MKDFLSTGSYARINQTIITIYIIRDVIVDKCGTSINRVQENHKLDL